MSFSRVLGAAADPASRAVARYTEEESAGCLGSASKDSVRCSEEGSAGCLGSASEDSVRCSEEEPAGRLGSDSRDPVHYTEEASAYCPGPAGLYPVRLPGMKPADRSVLQELFQRFGLYIQMNSDRRNLS